MPLVGTGPIAMAADEPISMSNSSGYQANYDIQQQSSSNLPIMSSSSIALERSRSAAAGATSFSSVSGSSPRGQSSLHQHINHHARKRSNSTQGPSSINVNETKVIGVSPRPRMMSQNNALSSNLTSNNGEQHSSGRFTTNVSDFHLPTRSGTPISSNSILSLNSSNLQSTNPNVIRSEGEYNVSSASLPLLRRAAAAAAFANASRARLRRGSMLGREVAKEESFTSSDEDEDMGSLDEDRHAVPLDKSPSPPNGTKLTRVGGRSRSSSLAVGNGKSNSTEDEMQIEAGDVSLENVKLESRSRPSTPPPTSTVSAIAQSPDTPFETNNSLSSATNSLRGNGGRRGVGRSRGNQTFRDRGMQRVAASLRDEARPSDSEIASEAKLQRKLAPESDSITPNTPRLLAIGARSPTAIKRQQAFSLGSGGLTNGMVDRNHTSGSGAYDDDDFMFTDHFEPYDAVDSSDEEDFGSNSVKGNSLMTAVEEDVESYPVQHADGIAIPGAASSQREKLWLGFRESTPVTGLRASPGSERVLGKGRPTTASGPINAMSTSFGSPSLDTAMDSEPIIGFTPRASATMASPSMWGKTAKRKYDSDRYEPYSASLHKRRAVSPITIASAGIGGVGHLGSTASVAAAAAAALQRQRARSSTPGTAGQSPLLQAISQQHSPLLSIQTNNSGTFTNLPVPTPLSIPSPTLSVTRVMSSGLNYSNSNTQSFSKSLPPGINNTTNVTSKTTSAIGGNVASAISESPSSTRPSTPTNGVYPLPYFNSSMASPSLLSSSVGKNGFHFNNANGTNGNTGNNGASTPSTTANSTTVKGGSGPGYGSGALGLSLGSGTSKRFKQEQEEQEEQEDMLDDVNAIKLGEM